MGEKQHSKFMEMMQNTMLSLGTQSKPALVSTPTILNFESYKKEEKCSQYRERFENLARIKGTQDDKDSMKQTFLNWVGSEIYEMVKSINAPENIEKLTYIQIVGSLEKYLSPS